MKINEKQHITRTGQIKNNPKIDIKFEVFYNVRANASTREEDEFFMKKNNSKNKGFSNYNSAMKEFNKRVNVLKIAVKNGTEDEEYLKTVVLEDKINNKTLYWSYFNGVKTM